MPDLISPLPESLRSAVRSRVDGWSRMEGTRRLWARDATLWTDSDEKKWLGWLDVVRTKPVSVRLEEKVGHVLVLGMGGSSLCPYVLASTFGRIKGQPQLHVLDSTDPAQVRAAESRVEPAHSLFIVASKSGSTLEPNILRDYFLDRARAALGPEQAGKRFVAITDPGSALEKQAEADGFRAVVHGVPSIGGRFSALSAFGMVPAALMGLDVDKLMGRVAKMAESCGAASGPDEKNPGVSLGIILGEAALHGIDKLTIVAASAVQELGAWLEQLVAESTGKHGKAIIPVDKEGVRAPGAYGSDRLFVSLSLKGEDDPAHDAAVSALQRAGLPVVRLVLQDRYDLGAEFFRWEIATAVAGAVLGINAFDQPDVEAAKVEARRLTDEVEKTGALPPETPIAEEQGLRLFADPTNAAALAKAPRTLEGILRAHFARLGRGDYFALQAYLEMNEEHEAALQALRGAVLGRRGVATTLGFGPRFLHSTGQAHKGGPNTGVFLQVTCDDARDLPVPGRRYTFGVVKAAQARGDAAVLAARGRRFLRVHLPAAVPEALRVLGEAAERALS